MFHIHGVQGRVLSRTLEQLPQQLVTGVARIRRAEPMPAASLEPLSVASASARLSQPVTAALWSPVPSTAPGTNLRRVAALLLHTGLPGVPVAADDGEVLGFVSRTDLLRALTTDSPLNLWG